MPNAHSHAFQRDLRGAGRAQPRRLLVVADADDASRPGARPRVDAARGRAGLRRDAGRRLRRRRRVPLRPPRSRRPPVRGAQRAGARRRAGRARRRPARSSSSPPPTTAAGTRASSDPDVESFLARVDALREWADGRDGVSVAVAAHSVRAVPPDWLEAIAGYAGDHGLPRHVHASEQPREVRDCRAQHGASPIELLARTGFLGPRTSVDPRDPRRRARRRSAGRQRHDRRHLPHDRGQSRRRRAAGAGVPRRRGAPGHRLGLAGPRRPLRGDARARDRRAPGGHDAARAARPSRRPVGRAGAQRPGQPRPGGRRQHRRRPRAPRSARRRTGRGWRSRWPRAPRPLWSAVRPAARAPAGAACRSGRPGPARAGR